MRTNDSRAAVPADRAQAGPAGPDGSIDSGTVGKAPVSTVASGAKAALFTLFLINFLNFFDRTIPAVVLEPIRKEFALDDMMLGLMGTTFTLMYALAGLPLGRLSDRVRRTRVLAGGVFVWSLMTAASGLAWNFGSFLLIRLGVGIGEASCAPASNSMIGDLYPSKQRARALGLFMLGLPLGSLACFMLVGYLAHNYGWRAPFYLAAVPGFVVALLVLRLREPVRGAQEGHAAGTLAPVARPYRSVLAIPTLWWIIVSGAALNFASYAMSTFLPSLMIRYHHVNVAQAGMVAAIVLGVTGLIGLTAGGWIADRVHQAFVRGRLLLGAICLLVSAPLLWLGLTRAAGDVVAVTALLSLGWLLYFMYFVTVYASIQDVVEARLRATAMSVYFFFQYILGAGFGTIVTGALSDRLAVRAMQAEHAQAMTDGFRAIGLQGALSLAVPGAIFITGLALCLAARSFAADAARVAPLNGPSPVK
ncbi:MFS transporter [Duganella rhizosphaerae]|uniref:spinster family MFS transporter n=1 Tax=Duganella rhizosphaerae TaxID=2885763 RepID=UPI0030E85C99